MRESHEWKPIFQLFDYSITGEYITGCQTKEELVVSTTVSSDYLDIYPSVYLDIYLDIYPEICRKITIKKKRRSRSR